MSLTPEDIKRLSALKKFSKEYFKVEFDADQKTLTLIVNDTTRNSIDLADAEESFDYALEVMKNFFIELRGAYTMKKPKPVDVTALNMYNTNNFVNYEDQETNRKN